MGSTTRTKIVVGALVVVVVALTIGFTIPAARQIWRRDRAVRALSLPRQLEEAAWHYRLEWGEVPPLHETDKPGQVCLRRGSCSLTFALGHPCRGGRGRYFDMRPGLYNETWDILCPNDSLRHVLIYRPFRCRRWSESFGPIRESKDGPISIWCEECTEAGRSMNNWR